MARMTVGREVRFSAAHSLPHVPESHKCHRLHGHSYRVAVEVSGPTDPTLGWVIDFGVIDAALQTIVRGPLDHRHLNDIAGLSNPTSEALAQWCAARLRVAIEGIGDLRVASVVVHEGDGGGWARWEP